MEEGWVSREHSWGMDQLANFNWEPLQKLSAITMVHGRKEGYANTRTTNLQSNIQMIKKKSAMAGFEPAISGSEVRCIIHYAT